MEPQTFGSENVTRFLKEETGKMGLGVMVVNTDPKALGERIVSDLEAKRKALGWDRSGTEADSELRIIAHN